jgi:hypothetical protein
MPGEAANLLEYLRGRYPECEVTVMYEAGILYPGPLRR